MKATFEKRLLRKSAKARLGKSFNKKVNGRPDLRQKLAPQKRTIDARSVLQSRRRPNSLAAKRKARNILRKLNVNPTFRGAQRSFPLRRRRNQKRPIRRYPVSGVPDLLNMSVAPSLVQSNMGPMRLISSALLQPEVLGTMPSTSSSSKLSPIQGFRLGVRNLQPSVTLDDIYELFSNVGALRLCTLIRPGHAEVVYNELADAKEAIRRYHNRELDGRPMNVALVTQLPEEISSSSRLASRLGPKVEPTWQGAQMAPLNTNTITNRRTKAAEVDVDIIRRALFNVSSGTPSSSRRPVDFNVSLR